MEKKEDEFLKLLKGKFNKSDDDCLSGYEEEILQTIQEDLLKLYSGEPPDNQLDNQPGENKKIRAKVIEEILTNPELLKCLPCRGLTIKNVTITGHLNLEGLKINIPLTFRKCTFDEGVYLKLANTKSLSFYRSDVHGCLNLDSAFIDGQLICDGASFENKEADAIIAGNAIVTRSVFFGTAIDKDKDKGEEDKLFETYGRVNLEGIKITGKLNCSGGKFIDIVNKKAFFADNASIEGDVLLNDEFEAEGEVSLNQIKINGQLDCGNAYFRNPDGFALITQSSIISGSIFMNNGFIAEGQVNLYSSKIGGAICCEGGKFKDGNNKIAFYAENVSIEGDVLLNDGFESEGEVNLLEAKINGSLECDAGNFSNPGGFAVVSLSAIIGGSVFMNNGFSASGEVNLLGSQINGSLYCTSGKFYNPTGRALNCKKIVVDRDVFFDKPKVDNNVVKQPFEVKGEVKLCGAQISGELICSGGIFDNSASNRASNYAFISKGLKVAAVLFDDGFEPNGEVNLLNARIEGPFILKNVNTSHHYKLNLKGAYIRSLEDEKNSWPGKGKLVLNDLTYDNIEYAPLHSEDRIEWLGLNEDVQSLQPYRQLASVLDNKGWEKEARGIRIAMNNQLRKETYKPKQKFWLYIMGVFFDYGYNPFKVLKIALIVWLMGAIIYSYGNYRELMLPPTDSINKNESVTANDSKNELYKQYPEFNAFFYSLDVFLPIVDLHQETYWLPARANKECNIIGVPVYCLLIYWMYIQIIIGWFLTTMLVGGLTGLIRNK